jgi:hypothetical protein
MGKVKLMFEFPKDKCPKCKSENVKITDIFYEDEDGSQLKSDDSWDGHCNDCGWDFILVSV